MKYVAIIIIIVAAVFGYLIFFSGSGENGSVANNENMETEDSFTPLPPPEQPQVEGSTVVLQTNQGIIKISLNREAAPLTANNFAYLASSGYYDGLTFHRAVPGFVIQGGDPKGNGTGGPGYTITAEISLIHKRGSIATARIADEVNPERASSGSQFYIALQDLPMLDGQYTVFGEVIEGMDIVDAIAAVQTNASEKPVESVIIEKAYLE